MPSITVKNIPEELYEDLRQSAAANRRSINSEVIVCIERALLGHTMRPETVLARARLLREMTSEYRIRDEELTAAKIAGRP